MPDTDYKRSFFVKTIEETSHPPELKSAMIDSVDASFRLAKTNGTTPLEEKVCALADAVVMNAGLQVLSLCKADSYATKDDLRYAIENCPGHTDGGGQMRVGIGPISIVAKTKGALAASIAGMALFCLGALGGVLALLAVVL